MVLDTKQRREMLQQAAAWESARNSQAA